MTFTVETALDLAYDPKLLAAVRSLIGQNVQRKEVSMHHTKRASLIQRGHDDWAVYLSPRKKPIDYVTLPPLYVHITFGSDPGVNYGIAHMNVHLPDSELEVLEAVSFHREKEFVQLAEDSIIKVLDPVARKYKAKLTVRK